MLMLEARAQRRNAPVARRLVEHAVARDSLREYGRVGVLRHFQRIESGAQQEQELIAQNIACGTQLTVKTVLLAQLSRLAVGATVLEAREHQRHQRKLIEIRRELGYAAVVRPQHTGRRVAARDLGG